MKYLCGLIIADSFRGLILLTMLCTLIIWCFLSIVYFIEKTSTKKQHKKVLKIRKKNRKNT